MEQHTQYPPSLPLYMDRVFHSRAYEAQWASPIVFIPTLVLTVVLFLIGLIFRSPLFTALTAVHLPAPWGLLITSLIPPVILCLVIVLTPAFSSPVNGYSTMLYRDPADRHTRWNLAVVSTAHVHCGALAQSEWLSLLLGLSEEERYRALNFIQRVRRALQKKPATTARDLWAIIIASVIVIAASLLVFRFSIFESILHSLALAFVLQLLVLYIYVIRWRHIRCLLEIEDVFEELLPAAPPASLQTRHEDEVQQWVREQEAVKHPSANASPHEAPEKIALPPAPWE